MGVEIEMINAFCYFWEYLREHDASNWFVILVSLIVWPSVLWIAAYYLAHRTKQSVPRFLVTFTPTNITIGQTPCDAVLLTFINQTGSIVYLSRARLTEVQKRFPVPTAASRDMARGWRELVFAFPAGSPANTQYECILQTDGRNGRAAAAIAVAKPPTDAFYSYRPARLRKWFRCPKYFRLEYIVVVGEKKFSISTIY